MKKWGIYIVLTGLLVLAILVSPVLAKDPGPPEKGVLFEAIASLQQQVDELQAQVDAIDNSVIDGVDWSELSGIPADIADGDDDTQLTEAQVDAYVANNGYATSAQLPKLGVPISKDFDTSYFAETDGFVIASTKDDDVPDTLAWLLGSVVVPPPYEKTILFIMDESSSWLEASGASISFPVMKGHYWNVELWAGDAPNSYVYWIPFGN